MKRNVWVLTLAVVLVLAPGAMATIIPVSDAGDPSAIVDTQHNTILFGDKLFSGFTCTGAFCDAITGVIAHFDTAGNLGIRFVGGTAATQIGFGTTNLDTLIDYNVAIASGSQQITDIHMTFNGSTNALGNGSSGFAEVVETALNGGTHQISVFSFNANGSPVLSLTAGLDIPPTSSLAITKDILLVATCSQTDTLCFASASFSFIDQSFSQTPIPEPATMGLLGSALLGLGLIARKRIARR